MLSRSQDALMCSFAGNYDLEVSPEETILLTTKPYNQLPESLQKKVTEEMMYRHWGDYNLINQKEDPEPEPNLDQYQDPEPEESP